MSTLTLANTQPWLFAAPDGVSLLGLPAERPAKRSLPGSADDVLKTIASILDEMLNEVIARRTASEFVDGVNEAFPKYVNLVMAFAKVVTATVPRQTIVRLSSESLSELEADIREHGLVSFGENLRERAVFTVWTLRKITDLVEILERARTVDQHHLEKDTEFHVKFFGHALRARFHVDCLVTSMRTKHPLYPDVLPAIDDGLRSVVNAYAWIKQAVDLRFPADESQPLPEYWSDEDRELVQASMRDLARYDVE